MALKSLAVAAALLASAGPGLAQEGSWVFGIGLKGVLTTSAKLFYSPNASSELLRSQYETLQSIPGVAPEVRARPPASPFIFALSGEYQRKTSEKVKLVAVTTPPIRRTIDQMGADFSIDTIFHQQLTPGGIALVIISLIVLLTSLLAWALGWLNTWLALILVGLAAFELFVYGRGALTTIRYWNAPVAPATTLHFAHIGAVQRGRLRVHTFKCILEVRPNDGPPFQAEAVIPVREENVPGVRQGEVIQVKYLPGRPDSVIYHQAVE